MELTRIFRFFTHQTIHIRRICCNRVFVLHIAGRGGGGGFRGGGGRGGGSDRGGGSRGGDDSRSGDWDCSS